MSVQKPTVTGSPNNKLSSLSVDGFSIGPEFNTDRYEYSLIVPSSTETVNVNATAYDGKAKITGAGTVSLNYGANEINVAVARGKRRGTNLYRHYFPSRAARGLNRKSKFHTGTKTEFFAEFLPI